MQYSRREVLRAGLAAGVVTSIAGIDVGAKDGSDAPEPFELDEITLTDLQAGLKSGKYTAKSLVEKYLERIEAVDRKGPGLNCVIEVNPEATAIAQSLDKEKG